MISRLERWIVTLDEHEARLLRCERAGNGSWHAEPVARLANAWEDDHDLAWPGWTAEEDVRAHRARLGPLTEEQQTAATARRFARDVADWLGTSCAERRIDDLDLYAPTGSLSLLTRRLPLGLLGAIRTHAADLGWVEPSRLTRQAEIVEALDGSAPEGGGP